MAKQVINTEKVASAANKLRSTNTAINNAFKTLQNAAKRLEYDWKSAAGSVAHTTVYQLFQNSALRSAVMENYVMILEKQVNPAYENADTVNTKLADQFK